jgi:uncharacterized protein
MANILSIAFPFQQGVSAYPLPATNNDAIQSSIIQIIMTPIGSRVMRPLFGSNILNYIFAGNSAATQDAIESEIRSALGRWEPRITVTSVVLDTDEILEPGELLITVNYTVISSNQSSTVTVGV